MSCQKIVQVAARSRPIERGLAGRGLLARVLMSKYCDQLPLYRQSQIFAREGVELERSTLADWVGAIARYVLGAYKIHSDDTPVPVLCNRPANPPSGVAKSSGRIVS